MFDKRYGLEHYQLHNMERPSGMSKNDFICDRCFKTPEQTQQERKEEEIKTIKEEVKETKKTTMRDITERLPEFKASWDKHGFIEFKNEYIAILHRQVGMQVEFIIAFNDLTKEGYRLMAQDEGKQASMGGLSGGVDSRYYFQNMKYVS